MSLLAIGSTVLALSVLLTFKRPLVIALAPSGETLSIQEKPSLERDVEVALRKYIQLRYGWDPSSVKENLRAAKEFVASSSKKAFDSDLLEIQKFATDRNASQRAYANTVSIDLTAQVARIKGDRVTTIQGLTAAGPLSLLLQFETGPRTTENPWGVYVVRERNE